MKAAPAIRSGARRKAALSGSRFKKNCWLLTMVMPGAIWLLLVRYLPMFGVVLAFKNYRAYKPNTFWNNIVQSKWVGLDNFKFLNSPDTAIMIRNTLGYNALWIILGLVIAVSFAIMLSELRRRFAAKLYQTLMFFPYFLSWVVASYFVLAFLDPTSGMIPAIQKSMGLKVTNFYHDKTWWPLILTIASLWKNVGYFIVHDAKTIMRRRRNQVAADLACDAAQHPHNDHHLADHERGQDFQCGLRIVLQRAAKLRYTVSGHTGHRYLCVPRLRQHPQHRHELSSGSAAKRGGLHLHHHHQRDREEDRPGKHAVLKEVQA